MELKINDLNKEGLFDIANNVSNIINNKVNDISNSIINKVLPNDIANKVINVKNKLRLGTNVISENIKDIAKKIITGDTEVNLNEINFKDNIEKLISDIQNVGNLKSYERKEIDDKKLDISNEINEELKNQINKYVSAFEKNQEYINDWKSFYKEEDFKSMEKVYKKLEKNMKEILPIEEKIKEIREIENLHLLIKRKGGDFNFTDEELELAKRLI